MQCIEKVPVTNTTCHKWFLNFDVGDFLLDDASSDRRVEVDSNQIETLIVRTINIILHRNYLIYSKYPNQALKIICIILALLGLLLWCLASS